ncbi:hypothetical protein FRACYDRAFT_245851 [Fragilariopsis cylindrus CCMP1102]|uniref:Uncharacterized protein n=1 Tax=Fragilariopsis cylindrus CCMP1102 TaxID=635003 RepID=A0A1E7EZV0_9STRA|nr:hypothetical protein FRACYDRAFT_245851 [Fragilariopsis cylindrus CCMP1102]|eukprot:OEU11386.1 hypothetical protein FRACYDRAFT_245851 [Fragilariopsis cylindrus CCMP1102]
MIKRFLQNLEDEDEDDVRLTRRIKTISVIERHGKLPKRTRKKVDRMIKIFLRKLGNDIYGLLCSNKNLDSDDYRGLDSDRDTEEEVETAIRFFPGVLSTIDEDANGDIFYPILRLAFTPNEDNGSIWYCNVKAVSFIPLLARLAMELGLFEEEERGGLLIKRNFNYNDDGENVLQSLMLNQVEEHQNEEHQEHNDDVYLQVLIQLRKIGLLQKEDIQKYDLLRKFRFEYDYFPEKRFRFLVEWDPNVLIMNGNLFPVVGSIRSLQVIFENGIRYFPKKKGLSLLFKKYVCDDLGNSTHFPTCV